MAAKQEFSEVEVRLWRLWKGTLLVGVVGGYAVLIALLLIQHEWQAALLGLAFVVVAQFFRYIANDVDRIGWGMEHRRGNEADADQADAVRHQTRLFWLLVGLAQLLNLALVGQALALGGLGRALATLLGLAFVEVLFSRIRQVNRRVEFQQASYGLSEGALHPNAKTGPWDEARLQRLNRRLERLKAMADAGEISQRAYRKERDKWRVRSVMDDETEARR